MKGFAVSRLDAIACGLSATCVAHCLGLPFIALAVPVVGVAAEAEWVHWALVAAAAPVSWLALRRHGAPQAARILAVAGVALLVIAAAELGGESWETPLSVAGAIALASAHLLNAHASARRGHAHPAPAGD